MTTTADQLPAALDSFERVAVDVGCGDGKYALRLAQRDPDRLVVGIDPEITRLARTLATARKRRLANLLFLGWSMDAALPVLGHAVDEIHVVAVWQLAEFCPRRNDSPVHVLELRPVARYESIVNCRPWDAPSSVDAKLSSTPVPTEETLAKLAEVYEQHGWRLDEPRWLDEGEARAVGSSWVSRVVSARRAMLLRLSAVKDA